MADIDKNAEKEVTVPLLVKKPEIPPVPDAVPLKNPEAVGEDDQTAKISRPLKLGKAPNKPVITLVKAEGSAKTMDAVPLTKPESGEEEKTARIPKPKLPLTSPGASDKSATKIDTPEVKLKPVVLKKPDAVPLPKPPAGEEDQTSKIPKPLKLGAAAQVDKKVVLNSATDSTIKPSDATTMAPAVVPAAIDMKPTESGNVAVLDAVVPAVAKPATATPPPIPATSNQGRKTIKLKPLKKDVPPDDDNVEETISMDRDALLEGGNMPSLAGGTAAKNDDFEDEATVKIQKPQISKPVHPTPVVPGSKGTIKLRPSTTPPPVGVSPVAGITRTEPAADNESEETVSVSKKTIRLVPKKPGEDDSTQKTPKQDASAPPKPSAPTIKLQDQADDVTQKTPRPSASTVKMPEESAAAAVPVPLAAPASSKKTLKLKATTPAAPPPQAADQPGGGMPLPPADATATSASGPPIKAAGLDPGIVMTLVAVLALVLVAYYTWMVGGQWAEQHMEVKSANVPALSGKVK
jgi:hypothetical protein